MRAFELNGFSEWYVDGSGLLPCTVAAFGINSVEPLGSAAVCFEVV